MRIGNATDYLLLERRDAEDPYSAFRVEARMTANRGEVSGSNDAVFFSLVEGLNDDFAAFEALRSDRSSIALSEGGSLLLCRDKRGHVEVRFTIAHASDEASMSGVVRVHGEDRDELVRELRSLVFSQEA